MRDVRDVGVLLDAVQFILMVAVAGLLWWNVRMVRQLQAVSRFWLKLWWATFEETEGDRSGPQCLSSAPPVHSSDP
jgi:hypothetical protein